MLGGHSDLMTRSEMSGRLAAVSMLQREETPLTRLFAFTPSQL